METRSLKKIQSEVPYDNPERSNLGALAVAHSAWRWVRELKVACIVNEHSCPTCISNKAKPREASRFCDHE